MKERLTKEISIFISTACVNLYINGIKIEDGTSNG